MKITNLKNRGVWQVDFGTKVPQVKDPDGNGKMVGRRTSRFKTEDELEDWLAKVRLAEKNQALSMSNADKMVFQQATDKLKEAGFDGVSLNDVVDYYLKYNTSTKSDKTVGECYELWLESYSKKQKANTRSGSTGSDVKRIVRFIKPYFDQNVSVLDMPEVCESIASHVRTDLEDKKPTTVRNAFTKLKQFINWMKRKDVKLLTSEITNQLDDLSEVEVPVRKAPHFLAPHEARELMHTALLTDERCNLLPFFIFHCFLGCRPSELLGVSWKDVKLEDANEPFVLIPERVTGKNKRPRKVKLDKFPAIVQWLKMCDWSKPLFPFKLDSEGKMERKFYEKRRIVLAEAVLLPLDAPEEESDKFDDIGRHTCATYLYQGDWDAKTIADRLGNTEKVLLGHYLNMGATESESKEFFSIVPEKAERKLVQFVG